MDTIDVNTNLEPFKKAVKEYITIDDDIKHLEQAVRKRKQKKKILSNYILTFMSQHNIEDLNTNSGSKLKKSVSYTKKPLNKTTITHMLKEYYKNDQQGEKVANFIINKRAKVERLRLKRIIKKTTK